MTLGSVVTMRRELARRQSTITELRARERYLRRVNAVLSDEIASRGLCVSGLIRAKQYESRRVE